MTASKRDFSWIRTVEMKDSSSTFNADSLRARIGLTAERLIQDHLQNFARENNIFSLVETWEYCNSHKKQSEKDRAINNSIDGDLIIFDLDGKRKRSIEVKSSTDHPNVTFKTSTFDNSKAEFLVALTTAGLWCCTMDEARRVARFIVTDDRHNGFWLITEDLVVKSPLEDVLK